MSVLQLKKNLKKLEGIAKELKKAQKMSVDIGLISDEKTSQAYESGRTVLQVGIVHEFGGRGMVDGVTIEIPQRSFLQLPFLIKKKVINKSIETGYKNILNGKSTTRKALGLIGVVARNIIVGAFNSDGYGQWQPLALITIERKGSSAILIDTGVLKQSITWAVRDSK